MHTVVTSSVGFSCVSSCLPVPGLVAVIFHLAYSSSGMSTIFLLCFFLKKVFSVQVVLPDQSPISQGVLFQKLEPSPLGCV